MISGTVGATTEDERIQPFRSGVTKPLEILIENTLVARKLLTAGNALSIEDPDARKLVTGSSAYIDNRLKEFERLYNETIMALGSGPFASKAKRNFFAEFPHGNDRDAQKRAYIELKLTGTILRNLHLKGKKAVAEIKEKTGAWYEHKDLASFLDEFYTRRIGRNEYLLDSIGMLLVRYAKVLKVSKELTEGAAVVWESEYRATRGYAVSEVFRPEHAPKDAFHIPNAADFNFGANGAPVVEAPKKSPASGKAPVKAVPKFVHLGPDGVFDAQGTEDWNQGYPYTLSIKTETLEKDKKILKSCIFAEMHLGAEEKTAKGLVLRRFVSSKKLKNYQDEYNRFLDEYFEFLANSAMLNLGLSPDLREALLFHLGPMAFAQSALRFLSNAKTGTIHYHKPNAPGRIIKYIPVQYIYFRLTTWWARNVIDHLGDKRNDYRIFKRVAAAVGESYNRILTDLKPRMQEIMAEYGPRTREQGKNMVKQFLNNQVGIVNMAIYRRYRNRASA